MKATAEKSSTTTSPTATQTTSQPFFAKAGSGGFFESAKPVIVPGVQMKMTVNRPGDKFEQEADRMADKVMRTTVPGKKEDDRIQKAARPEEKMQRAEKKEEEKIQRKSNDGTPAVSTDTQSGIQNKTTGGQPLSADVRSYMEPRFGADFSNVRIHSDAESAGLSNQLSARAFTYQNHVFFSRDQYQPGTGEGKQLLAHELTHTIQQGHAVQRSPQVSTTTTPPPIQRLGIDDALDYFANTAYNIPGFRMFTIIIGVNPINMQSTDRSAANILRAIVEFLPGGNFITRVLDHYGVLERAGSFVEQQLNGLGISGSSIRDAVMRFLNSLGWRDILRLGSVWERAQRIFTEPIGRLIGLARNLFTVIKQFIWDAVLRPLASLAARTSGYDLIKAILGRDPITGDAYPRTADTLIGGFMKLIGQEEVWENIKRGNAVGRAWAWFQGVVSELLGFVTQIPTLFINTLRSLELGDFLIITNAFGRILGAFGNFVGNFISWAGSKVLSLLEILFSVVAPGAMPFLQRAAGAFQLILRNPVGFVGNLVRAGVQGFRQFSTNILTHLRAGLVGWLTGALTGLTLPTEWNFRGILSLVLQVLGLTWPNMRGRLVRALGERPVAVLETTFGLVTTLVREGPVAAWRELMQHLGNLQEMLFGQIRTWIQNTIVGQAVIRIVSMLNPAGAVIPAIIAIYNTIMFFVERMRQIGAVVESVVNSLSAIAAGAIGPAANAVEQTMARLVPVVISFLARLIGLGGISQQIQAILRRIQQPINNAIDRVVAWIVTQARRLVTGVAQAGLPQDPNERLRLGMQAALGALNRFSGQPVGRALLTPILGSIKLRYGFRELEVLPRGRIWGIRGMINPVSWMDSGVQVPLQESPPGASSTMIQQLLGLRNEGGREIEVLPGRFYGKALQQTLRQVHPQLLSKSTEERIEAIDRLRLNDKVWTVLQGMIYSPFVGEQQQAVRQLRTEAEEPAFLYSLERGGSLVAEQIARGTNIEVISIPKVRVPQIRQGQTRLVTSKTAQVNNLKSRIIRDLSGDSQRTTSVVITETMVGGGSVDALINMATELVQSNRFPNIRFKILALQQTMHTEDSGRGVVEIRQNRITEVDKVKLVVASVPYILGEDVTYQIARRQAESKSPVIVFKATNEAIYAYQIVPLGETTARDVIVDLIDGKYNGRLRQVL